MLRTAVAVVSSAVVAATLLVSGRAPIAAQQQPPPAGAQPPAGQAPARAGPQGAAEADAVLPFEDRTGFESMFNGTASTPVNSRSWRRARLTGSAGSTAAGRARTRRGGDGDPISRFMDWNGDPRFWRVENGTIVGESTRSQPVKQNTFLIWRGGEPGDFELKAEFRMNATNSGIQYRSRCSSRTRAADDKPGQWVLEGYQADIDFANGYTGMLYEEARPRIPRRARHRSAYIAPNGTKGTIGQARERPTRSRHTFKPGDWNQFHVIARGNTLIHILNGRVTAVLIDDDAEESDHEGLLGFQIHTGPPMKVEFRNVIS